MPPLESRSYTANRFGLTIDGAKVSAYIRSVEGGFPKGQDIVEPVGPDNLRVKHLGPREIDPFQIEIGLSGSKNVLQWISDSWNRKFSRRGGQVTHADFNMFGKFEHEFTDALISEVSFPALDGGSKEPGYIKFKFLPEAMKSKVTATPRIAEIGAPEQKMYNNKFFRMRLDGIDCENVNRIESFTIKQGIKPLHIGREMFPQIEPTKIEFPDIKFDIALEFAGPIKDWFDKMVKDGGRDPSLEKTGTIEYLNPALQTVFTIKLMQVGVKSFTVVKSEAQQSKGIKRARTELYVGAMSLEPGTGM